MRKHLAKVPVLLLLAGLVATLWLGADWLGSVRRRINVADTSAAEMEYALNSTEVPPKQATETFRSNAFLSAIRQMWATGVEARTFSPGILAPPERPRRR